MELNLDKLNRSAQELRVLSTQKKNAVLKRLSRELKIAEKNILSANRRDLRVARKLELGPAFLDRLTLTPQRIALMAEGVLAVARLADPVGEVIEEKRLKNGLKVKRVRAPFGSIFVIFESRPNVVVDAFSIGFKSGNALVLKGGKESLHTCAALYKIIHKVLKKEGVSSFALQGLLKSDRATLRSLLKRTDVFDLVIPRGGDRLIQFVTKESRIPVIKNDRGMCHLYVDSGANLSSALNILKNAKCSRPGVCNSIETVLVHQHLAEEFLPQAFKTLSEGTFSVEWFCCPTSFKILKGQGKVRPAKRKSFDTEYLDFKINCRVVKSLDDALQHIEQHGSRHSEAIVSNDLGSIGRFLTEVDAAAVYSNASTRFTDGYELGLGAEIGISTQKLHVRGPVGLRELTSLRWVIEGNGQIRA